VTRAIRRSTALAAAILALAAARSAEAQRIRFEGRGEIAVDTVLQRIAGSGRYTLLTADTIYPASDTLQGPVLIAATTAKFEGVILGDVAIIDANVFLRPGSRITGDVVSITAGLFRAPGSTIDGTVREWTDAEYYAVLDDEGVRITGSRVASLFDLDGFGGLRTPGYDRVAGLTAAIGARYLLPRIALAEPFIHGWVGYQTARERLIGGLDIGFEHTDYSLAAGVERTVFTNDAWNRGWTNSITYLWSGTDYRDYYAADRFFLRQQLAVSSLYSELAFSLDARVEDARSIPSLDPWNAFGDSARANPLVDDGRITSATLGLDAEWERSAWLGSAHASIEAAGDLLDGDHSFVRFDLGGELAINALADHTLRVKWRLRGPLGSDSLPRQRWNTIGGQATLPTLDAGELRGDRLVWVETDYVIPIPGVRLPVLERPAIELQHRIGNAWRNGQDSDLIQNIGASFRFRIFWLTGMVDPSDTDRSEFRFGVSLPRRYPWSPID
jgi:hypothetical protein